MRDLGLRVWGERSPRLDDLTLFEAEEVLIRRALARSNGDWRWAAADLGLTPFDGFGAGLAFRRRHGLKTFVTITFADFRLSCLSEHADDAAA